MTNNTHNQNWLVELRFGYDSRTLQLMNVRAEVDVDGIIHRVDMAWRGLLMPNGEDFETLKRRARRIVTYRLNGEHEIAALMADTMEYTLERPDNEPALL